MVYPDVELVRTDVRVANLSYIRAGWYIDMMRQKAFESDPMPLSLPEEKYLDGIRTQLPVNTRIDKPVDIKQIVAFAGEDDRKFMIDISGRGDYFNYIPSNKFIIDVDTAKVLSNGTVKKYFRDSMVSPMVWEYTETDALRVIWQLWTCLEPTNGRDPFTSQHVPSSQYKGLEKFCPGRTCIQDCTGTSW